MTDGIQIVSGHRLRDLVAALSVIAVGTAVAMAVVASDPTDSLLVPSVLFGAGCFAILGAFTAGYITDGLAERFPGLSRSRCCPWYILWGVPLLTAGLASTQVDAAAMAGHARDVVTQVRDALPVE